MIFSQESLSQSEKVCNELREEIKANQLEAKRDSISKIQVEEILLYSDERFSNVLICSFESSHVSLFLYNIHFKIPKSV